MTFNMRQQQLTTQSLETRITALPAASLCDSAIMPTISWCQLNSLLGICILQWALFSYLLVSSGHHAETTTLLFQDVRDSFFMADRNKNCPCDDSNTALMNTENTNQQQHNDWQGVAVGLMLKRPKWFYRRYHVMINTVLMTIPDNWGVQLLVADKWFHDDFLEFHVGLKRMIVNNNKNHRIRVTILPANLESKKPKQLLKEAWVWENMEADRVIMFHGGGTMCANSKVTVDDFGHLDYVGVPWHMMGGLGGAGTEYSIRSRKAMLAALRHTPPPENQAEDVYFISTLRQINKENESTTTFAIASPNETQLFAGIDDLHVNKDLKPDVTDDSWGPLLVVGTHGDVSDGVRTWIIGKCPEIKMIYPSLHNPHCFGASPNQTGCVESLFSNMMNGA